MAMSTEQQVKILAVICTQDEAGTHFMARYDYDELQELEEGGWLTINRPVHDQTGIAYSQEYWSVEVTEDGINLVEMYPEYLEDE